ncbi:MAG: 50S ribosomal protein L9 [Alphaproteobacteria bacterium]|nr:50S ribosomal protein L9 [Alphaproteobacteria bacterium]
MQVILVQNVYRLGTIGEVVDVRSGYARNFLIPRNAAVAATKQNMKMIEDQKADLQRKNEERREAADKLAVKVAESKVILIRQAGEDGRLFGSVAPRDVSRALAEVVKADSEITAIIAKPIKNVGIYSVKIVLHPDVSVQVSVNVARSQAEALSAEQEAAKPKKKDKAEQQAAEELAAAAAPEGTEEVQEKAKKKVRKAKADDSEESDAAE